MSGDKRLTQLPTVADPAAGDKTYIVRGGNSREFDLGAELVDLQEQITESNNKFPSSSTDNAIARYDGSNGELQDSPVTISDQGDIDGVRNQKLTGYTEFSEISTPGTPSANNLRLYAKDVSGSTRLIALDSAGIERDLVPRSRLAATTTYYVSTAGSDSNTGLSSGSPFATLQHAWDTIANNVDLAGQRVNIQLADGTYTNNPIRGRGPSVGGAATGSAEVWLVGNIGTPANVIVTATNDFAVRMQDGAKIVLSGLELRTASVGSCISASSGAVVYIDASVRFGTCADAHIQANRCGVVVALANYSIVGSATYHHMAYQCGVTLTADVTVTFSGTPAFTYYSWAFRNGTIDASGCTFSGSATGKRFLAQSEGVIIGNGSSLTYLPGSTAGTVDTGGSYDGNGSVSATVGSIGYAAGAGGTVTQQTNKATAVQLDTYSGQITMNNAALNAGIIAAFVLTNNKIAPGDLLILSHVSGGTPGSYLLNARAGSGAAAIDVRNVTAGNLSDAIVIGFVVIKGAVT